MTGSSQQSQVSSIGIPESASGQDCLAWKSVLLFTLNALIDQGMRRNYSEQRRSNPDHPNYQKFTKPMPAIDVTEVLSVKNTRKLMELIIEKEGGKCHKELLMESRCMFNHFRGSVIESRFDNIISYEHLHNVLQLSLHQERLSEYDEFLRKYHSGRSYGVKGFSHAFYCHQKDPVCARSVAYTMTSSLGFCLLKKHQTLLKDRGIFDLSGYDYYANNPSVSIDENSLQKFIDRSNMLSQ